MPHAANSRFDKCSGAGDAFVAEAGRGITCGAFCCSGKYEVDTYLPSQGTMHCYSLHYMDGIAAST